MMIGQTLAHYRITAALGAGIDESRIVVDPGIGFAKTAEQNLQARSVSGSD